MSRDEEKKPIPKMVTYLKFGFVITEHESYLCPTCGHILGAGSNYQPRYCDQRVSFSGIEWKENRELGFAKRGGNAR